MPGLQGRGALLPAEAKGLLLSCIEDDDPCVCVEHTQLYWTKGAPEPGLRIPPGKAHVARQGSDVSVITYGRPVGQVLELAEKLADDGISVEVIDLRTISVGRGDRPGIGGVHRTCRHRPRGGRPVRRGRPESPARIGEELLGQLHSPVVRVTSVNSPVPFSRALEEEYLYKISDVESAIRKSVS